MGFCLNKLCGMLMFTNLSDSINREPSNEHCHAQTRGVVRRKKNQQNASQGSYWHTTAWPHIQVYSQLKESVPQILVLDKTAQKKLARAAQRSANLNQS